MKKKMILLCAMIMLLGGCTKYIADDNKKRVVYEVTGQSLPSNILCKPSDDDLASIYEKYKDNLEVNLDNLPKCEDIKIYDSKNYNGLWVQLFVMPLAWVIVKIGTLVKSYGVSVMIVGLLIRLILMPFSIKATKQSQNMQKAQKDLNRLEEKYKNRTDNDAMMQKSQEMMMIYQKYKINPISGCLLAIIQLPLLFAFLEAINRTPAIFENKFLVFEMGTTVPKGIASGNYWYIILIILILGTTYLSFRKTLKDQSLSQQGGQMKFTLYFMLVIIAFASFSLPTALGLYWIASSTFTIVQNLLVERKKK